MHGTRGKQSRMGSAFACNNAPIRDGYKLYYSDVELMFPVNTYPKGYRFMEAIVDEKNGIIKFANYGTFDTEYSTDLKIPFD